MLSPLIILLSVINNIWPQWLAHAYPTNTYYVLLCDLYMYHIGYAFGGLLALSVYTSVWNQACLSISNLSQNTMCITFGVPVIPLKTVEDTLEHIPEMKENSHIFHYQGDFVPRLLRFDDISSTNGTELPDKVIH